MRLSMQHRLIGLGIAVLASLAFLAGTAWRGGGKVVDATTENTLRLAHVDAVQSMRLALLQLSRMGMEIIVDRGEGAVSPDRAREIADAASTLTTKLPSLRQAMDTGEERRLVQELDGHLPLLIRAIQVDLPAMVARHAGADTPEAQADFARIDDAVDAHAETALSHLAAIAASIEGELRQSNENLALEAGESVALSLWVGGVMFLLAGVGFFLVARGIVLPMRATVAFADAVSAGRLDERLDHHSHDELGRLADALRGMVASLKQSLAEAREQGEQARQASSDARRAMEEAVAARAAAEQAKAQGMLDAARKLESVADVVAAAAGEISSQVEQSSQGASTQSRHLGETATAMEEMNASMLEVARGASRAAETADAARHKALAGEDVVRRVVESITAVNEQAQALRADMGDLGSRAEGISQVMSVINDIADQTNLLALNAAIEAARAGDAGRGFAVVADEVRKLAEKTMTATREVGQAVAGIRQGASRNQVTVDRAAEAIDAATRLAGESGEALRAIVTLVEETTDQVRAIATASEEQSAASEEINRGLDDVRRIAEESSDAMHHSSRSVSSMADQAQHLQRLIDELKAEDAAPQAAGPSSMPPAAGFRAAAPSKTAFRAAGATRA